MTRQDVASRRPPSPVPTKGYRKRKAAKQGVVIVDVIDEALRKQISLTENGRLSRVSVFEAIYRKLLQSEMAGDSKAFRVRLAYDKFAREMKPSEEPKIRVIGGLPEPRGADHG